MAKLGWLRGVLSVIVGLLIGVVMTALVNLFIPTLSGLVWTVLLAVCASSVISSLVGYLLGARRKKEVQETPH
jgi:Na+/citrate or Na+/malate symporter